VLAGVFAVASAHDSTGAEIALTVAACLAAIAAVFSGRRVKFQSASRPRTP
jgi:hypothetical protein